MPGVDFELIKLRKENKELKAESAARLKVITDQRDYICERIDVCNRYSLLVGHLLDMLVGEGDDYKEKKQALVDEAWEFAGKELERMKKEIIEENLKGEVEKSG